MSVSLVAYVRADVFQLVDTADSMQIEAFKLTHATLSFVFGRANDDLTRIAM